MNWREERDAEVLEKKAQRRREYEERQAEEARKIEQHSEFLFQGLGTPRSILERVYFYAYQEGHSSGLAEVEHHFEDVVELVELAYKAGRRGE